jgi:hypothetical protein
MYGDYAKKERIIMNKKTMNKLAAQEQARDEAERAERQAQFDAKRKPIGLVPFINLASMDADTIITDRINIIWRQMYQWEHEASKATNKFSFTDEATAMAALVQYSAYNDLDKFMDRVYDHIVIARTNRDGHPIDDVPSVRAQVRHRVSYKVASLIKEYF